MHPLDERSHGVVITGRRYHRHAGIRLLDFLASIIGIRVRERASARLLALGHSGRVHLLHVDADTGELFSHATLDSVAGLDIRHDPAKYEYAVRGTVNGQPFNERVFAYPVGGITAPRSGRPSFRWPTRSCVG